MERHHMGPGATTSPLPGGGGPPALDPRTVQRARELRQEYMELVPKVPPPPSSLREATLLVVGAMMGWVMQSTWHLSELSCLPQRGPQPISQCHIQPLPLVGGTTALLLPPHPHRGPRLMSQCQVWPPPSVALITLVGSGNVSPSLPSVSYNPLQVRGSARTRIC